MLKRGMSWLVSRSAANLELLTEPVLIQFSPPARRPPTDVAVLIPYLSYRQLDEIVSSLSDDTPFDIILRDRLRKLLAIERRP